MIRLACLAIGYAFGLFQTAFIYGKAHGIDIRQHGSGNSGTTNALRVLGRKAGLIVFAGDFFKCVLAVLLVRLLFSNSYGDMIYLLCLYTAAGAILGHNFPFYMGFRGGKGIAATAGMIASLHPIFWPVALLVFGVTFGISHYVSLGSLLLYVGFVVEVVICGQCGLFGMSQPLLNEMYIVAFLLAVMAFWKHRENIKRLAKGVENKTYLSKKNRE